jgi:hypothetical protein
VEVAAEDDDDDDDTWKAKKTEERTVEVTGRTDAACQKNPLIQAAPVSTYYCTPYAWSS